MRGGWCARVLGSAATRLFSAPVFSWIWEECERGVNGSANGVWCARVVVGFVEGGSQSISCSPSPSSPTEGGVEGVEWAWLCVVVG